MLSTVTIIVTRIVLSTGDALPEIIALTSHHQSPDWYCYGLIKA
jgi:hypothetical protein